MLNIISLGAGVQSSTMALMAAHGEFDEYGKVTACIFADTQGEPRAVYEWLSWLIKQLPFPVYNVTAGNLKNESLHKKTSKDGKGTYIRNVIPAFTLDDEGKRGMLLRKCTTDFKIAPLKRKQREIMKEFGLKNLCSWIGISLDEAHRMKPSRVKYIINKWPLVEKRITRFDCLQWMKKHNYPEPPKSACTFCPYHDNDQWKHLKLYSPKEFQEAVDFERDWNYAAKHDTRPSQMKGTIYLHADRVPLDEVDFSNAEDHGQLNMFGNECEGMCGV